MQIDYRVKAAIIDINQDQPKAKDIFLVDTNVWYWIAYPKTTAPVVRQENYSRYMERN